MKSTKTALAGSPKQIAWAEDLRTGLLARMSAAAEAALSNSNRVYCIGADASEADVAEWAAEHAEIRGRILAAIAALDAVAEARVWIDGRGAVSSTLRAAGYGDAELRGDVEMDITSLHRG